MVRQTDRVRQEEFLRVVVGGRRSKCSEDAAAPCMAEIILQFDAWSL